MGAEYRVLGPLEVLLDGAAVSVPAGRCRVLLATLLLRPNHFVSADELVERLWDGEPVAPDRAYKTLQMVVVRLRQALGTANCVQTSRGGYRASVDVSQLDLLRFRSLVSAGDFAAAVGLWRGPMLSDVRSDAVHQHDVPPVTEEWLLALDRRISADLDRGLAADLVAELRSLTAQHPFRETFWGQLMLALAQSGQQAAALAAYQEIRSLLADELGVDPGAELQAVHQHVLSGSVRVRGPVPRQLPTAVPRFVGRSSELRGLSDLAGGDALMIVAITGTAGVGKTTLAVHWARGVADHFPDGQLYVNLRGFDRHRDPMAPGDALSRMLEALGVLPERIPADLEATSALYRSMIADRRMLVVLDNARDAEHVRPLLPGPCPSQVLITSRDRLTGLIITEGIQHLALDVLSHAEAHALLVGRLGAERVGASDELIKWCGGLPLALAIVAARAAQSPSLPLSALVAELADERTRLDTLDTGDAATSVRTVFQWSYQQLSPVTARMFRLIGVHPGPDITVPAARSLAGLSADETRECLRELVRANLLVEHVPGRFTCHDLLRVYAADRAAAEEPSQARDEAVERMFDHYLHTLIHIDVEFNGRERWLDLMPRPAPHVASESFVERDAADEWFQAERAVLRAVLAQSDHHRFDRHTWQLTWFGFDLIDRDGRWQDWLAVLPPAERASARLGEADRAAKFVFFEAIALGRLNRFDESVERFEASSRAYEALGRVPEQVRAQNGLAWALTLSGRPNEALEITRQALELQRGDASATDARIAMAVQQVAWVLLHLGEYAEALEYCAEWESLAGDEASEGWLGQVSFVKGQAYLALVDYPAALAAVNRAFEAFQRVGSWMDLNFTRGLVGDVHLGLGDVEEARRWWIEALMASEVNQHPFAQELREKLASLP
ncbi:BTAD domain-containing putative transcriptional regulator [Lentzea sp. NPDC051213]|uniref:AfsR/SARP family transcriptional regulator n=1 Tax=Lentzea sp. NPDC051213 TaxID=3364126 RepID=UPI00379CE260